MKWIALFIAIFVLLNIYLFSKFPTRKKMYHDVYDVCIILGSPTQSDGTCSRMQMSRMNRAIELYKANKVLKFIISGGCVINDYSEARTMMNYALQQGIHPSDILLEEKASNSYENLLYSKEVCIQHKFQSVIVVTSNFHVRRASYFVHKFFDDYAMAGTREKEKIKHYFSEYIRLWNTLRIELQKKLKK